jgi:hypothetical protein
MPIPPRPEVQVRGAGFLGLGLNVQDIDHQRRMTELYHLGVETVFTEAMAMGFELSGLKATGHAMQKAEQLVAAQPNDSVAAMLTADVAGEIAARLRARHARLAEVLDAEAMNVLHRR